MARVNITLAPDPVEGRLEPPEGVDPPAAPAPLPEAPEACAPVAEAPGPIPEPLPLPPLVLHPPGAPAEPAPAAAPAKPAPRLLRPARRPHRARHGGLIAFIVLMFAAIGLLGAGLALTGQPIRVPVWLVAEAEARANAALSRAITGRDGADGVAAVSVGGAVVVVGPDGTPRLELQDLRLMQADGAALVSLPEARLTLDPAALLRGQLRPASLRLSGGQVALGRRADGTLDLSLGGTMPLAFDSLAALFDAADAAFGMPALSGLARIEAEGLSLTFTDRVAGRVWEMGDGRLTVENRGTALAAQLSLSLVAGGAAPATAQVTAITDRGGPGARLSVTVQGVAAGDVAALSGGLAFLGVLDAPLSGRIDSALDAATGAPAALTARLDIAAGALRPGGGGEPVPFDRAVLDLAYDPARERIDLPEIALDSPSLRLAASGHAYVPGAAADLPAEVLGQIALNEVRIDPEGTFAAPAVFTGGALDLRLRLDPFAVDIGQLVLLDGDRRLSLRGRVAEEGAGWRIALDAGIDAIAHDRLLSLWPLRLVPMTRGWLAENVQEGTLTDLTAAVRLEPGRDARLSLTYEFAGAGVRFVPTLPPIEGGAGYATVEGTRYTLVLDRGAVVPPKGGPIAVAGSVFAVPDITLRPARAEIDLVTEGSLTATLSLLDLPPFGFLTKAGRAADLGEGRARVRARLALPLLNRVLAEDVDWRVEGVVEDLRSEVLVPGRVLAADRLTVTADPAALRIAGPGSLEGVAFDATYTLPLGPGSDGGARVEGTMALSAEAARRLGLGLPEGMVSGAGQGRIAVDLPKGATARLRLTSDLRGLGLALPEIAWSKARGASGQLEVAARLSAPAVVERLAVEAPGLAAQGRLTLRPGGGLERASFERVRAGAWFEGPVTLIGRGARASPDVEVGGGRLDLRQMPDGLGRGGGAGGGGGGTITARLDRLQITETIGLTGLRGTFTTRGGLGGEFLARVNGGAPVQGRLTPGARGTIRVTAQDAGGVLSAAGIFPDARGGTMVMQLIPRPGGGYDGRADFAQVRVRNTPVLAELLNAASIVGLFEQLNGGGLLFQEADAEFRLSGAGVEISRAAAVGASMGVSMQGIYDAARGRLDLQGTISPFYLVNGIGAILTRRGEGLIGMNYRISGSTAAPVVSVNPLSVFTPGMFREIFRRPPPRISAGG